MRLNWRSELHRLLAVVLADNTGNVDAIAIHSRLAGRSLEAAHALLVKAKRDCAVQDKMAFDTAPQAVALIEGLAPARMLVVELEQL